MKRYFGVDEAAKYLSEKCGHQIRVVDVLESACRGEIRLCLFFDGSLAPFEEVDPFKEKIISGYPFSFRGYVQIPLAVITPNGGDVSFSAMAIVETIWMTPKHPLPKLDFFEVLCPYKCYSDTGEVMPTSFETNLGSASIPASDIEAQLAKLEAKENSSTFDNRAHVSNNLAILNQAAIRFWANADRDDRTTHHSQSEVVAWLMDHGFSDITAKSGATIIRPEWAPTGRKPKE